MVSCLTCSSISPNISNASRLYSCLGFFAHSRVSRFPGAGKSMAPRCSFQWKSSCLSIISFSTWRMSGAPIDSAFAAYISSIFSTQRSRIWSSFNLLSSCNHFGTSICVANSLSNACCKSLRVPLLVQTAWGNMLIDQYSMTSSLIAAIDSSISSAPSAPSAGDRPPCVDRSPTSSYSSRFFRISKLCDSTLRLRSFDLSREQFAFDRLALTHTGT